MMEPSGDGVTDLRGEGGVEFCGDEVMDSLVNGALELGVDGVMDLGSSEKVMESESE